MLRRIRSSTSPGLVQATKIRIRRSTAVAVFVVAATAACDVSSPVGTQNGASPLQERSLEVSAWTPDETGQFQLTSAQTIRIVTKGNEVVDTEVLASDIAIPDQEQLRPVPLLDLATVARSAATPRLARFGGFRDARPVRDVTFPGGGTGQIHMASRTGATHMTMPNGGGVRLERLGKASPQMHMKMTFYNPAGRPVGVVHVRGADDDQVGLALIGGEGRALVGRLGSFVQSVACRVRAIAGPSVLHAATVQSGDAECGFLERQLEIDRATLYALLASTGVGLTQVGLCFSGGAATFAACVGVGLGAAAAIYLAYLQVELTRDAYYDCLLQPPSNGGEGEAGGDDGQPTDENCQDELWCFSFDDGQSWDCEWIWTCHRG